jgi:hypothetical protein
LDKQRREISFAALTGDKQAKVRLKEINAEAASHGLDIASVEAALIVARANLVAAKATEAKATDKTNALQLREVVTEWLDRAANVDAAFEDIHSDLIAMQDLHSRMLQLGSRYPSQA